jgi:hypothetical protein
VPAARAAGITTIPAAIPICFFFITRWRLVGPFRLDFRNAFPGCDASNNALYLYSGGNEWLLSWLAKVLEKQRKNRGEKKIRQQNKKKKGKKNKDSKKNVSSNVRTDGFENTDANL